LDLNSIKLSDEEDDAPAPQARKVMKSKKVVRKDVASSLQMNGKVSSRSIAYAVIQVFCFLFKRMIVVHTNPPAYLQLVGHQFLDSSPRQVRFSRLLLFHRGFFRCRSWYKCKSAGAGTLGLVEQVRRFFSFSVHSPDLHFVREIFPTGGTHAHPSKSTSYKALEAQRAAREG